MVELEHGLLDRKQADCEFAYGSFVGKQACFEFKCGLFICHQAVFKLNKSWSIEQRRIFGFLLGPCCACRLGLESNYVLISIFVAQA